MGGLGSNLPRDNRLSPWPQRTLVNMCMEEGKVGDHRGKLFIWLIIQQISVDSLLNARHWPSTGK